MDGRASVRHWQSKQRLTTLPDPTTFTKPDASSAFPTQFATAPAAQGCHTDHCGVSRTGCDDHRAAEGVPDEQKPVPSFLHQPTETELDVLDALPQTPRMPVS